MDRRTAPADGAFGLRRCPQWGRRATPAGSPAGPLGSQGVKTAQSFHGSAIDPVVPRPAEMRERAKMRDQKPPRIELNHMMEDAALSNLTVGQSPTSYDVWQAASLLVGLLGADAISYAGGRASAASETDDPAAGKTWQRIACQIEHLLGTAPEIEQQIAPPDEELRPSEVRGGCLRPGSV